MDASDRQAAKKRLFRLRMIGISIAAVMLFVMSVQAVIGVEGLTLRGVAALVIVLAASGVGLAIGYAANVAGGSVVDEIRKIGHHSGSDEDSD